MAGRTKERKIKATPCTVYSLASVSKPMTATGVMILAEQGLIDLDQPIDTYLGDIQLTAYEGQARDATVARLLHHTAGLPTIWGYHFAGGKDPRPEIGESIRRYGILIAPPGEGYEYSNIGYGIAEALIQQVSGMSFEQFLRENLFLPLGMRNTFIPTHPPDPDSLALRYIENKSASPFFEVISRGGGGICSSLHDLLRFGLFHLQNPVDGLPPLSAQSIAEMQTHVDPLVPSSAYRLGWIIRYFKGHRILYHGGGMPGVTTTLQLVPDKNIAIAILCNGTYIDLDRLSEQILLQLLPPQKNNTPAEKKENPNRQSKSLFRWKNGSAIGVAKSAPGPENIPVSLHIQGKNSAMLTAVEAFGAGSTTVENLTSVRFDNDRLTANAALEIPTSDAKRCRHFIALNLKHRGDRLCGFVAATSYRVEVFCYPYYTELKRDIFTSHLPGAEPE